MKSLAAVCASLLLLSACSAFVPRLETPDLSIVGIELIKSDLFEQRLRVRMRVQNPNDRALPIRGITLGMEVNGKDFARGVAGESFTVPAFGEAEFDMMLTANAAGALLRMLPELSRQAPQSLDYRIEGKVSLSSGLLRSIPFEDSGVFKLE